MRDSNIEALIHPETGLFALLDRYVKVSVVYQDLFLEEALHTRSSYSALDEAEKEKLNKRWRNSIHYNTLTTVWNNGK